ncbi:hypothetical protein [Nguyenibacter vanlangensis]|uniref:Uncharacterized protein n=1 Tax=Nguyenibacter vanlangensis TaxID=1216886 RepID=A0A7Y7IU38_9PROT|nr:hypothetical protein [Nguyenibacter vanlangensis]NVN09855.1 hypothetical protein [Nguyenibacter vanlangensis]
METDSATMRAPGPHTTPGATPDGTPNITMHEAVARMACLLDAACEDLVHAQQAVETCVRGLALSDADMSSLQKLDVATQTVAAVTTVLRNLISLPHPGPADGVSVAGLYDGVTLGAVVRALKGTHAPDGSLPAGTIDLF